MQEEPRLPARGRGRNVRPPGSSGVTERRARRRISRRAHPRVQIPTRRDRDEHLRRVRRVVPPTAPVHTHARRPTPARTGSDRGGRERDERARGRVLRRGRDVRDVRERRGRPGEGREERLRDRARACAARLPRLQRGVEGVAVLAHALGEARVFGHPAFLQPELVRPGGGLWAPGDGRVADLPCPEEPVLWEGQTVQYNRTRNSTTDEDAHLESGHAL